MPILFKNAKKEVQRQYDELKARGFNPVANADGSTYSWIHKDTGEVYKGLDPISGIDADNGYRLRNHRQQRLMSELASANLMPRSDKSTPASKPPEPTTTTSTATPAEDKATVSSRITGFNIPTLTLSKLPEYQGGKSTPTPTPTLEPKADKDVEDLTPPVYDKDNPNKRAPFVYMPTDEWEKQKGPLERFWLNKYGTSLGEISDKINDTHRFGEDDVTPKFGHYATIKGVKHSLINNPDYVAPDTKTRDVLGHVGEVAQAVLSPANVAGINPKGIVESMTAARKATGGSDKGLSDIYNHGLETIKGWFKHGPTAEKAAAEVPAKASTLVPKTTPGVDNPASIQDLFNGTPEVTKSTETGVQYPHANLVPKSQGEQLTLDWRDAQGKFWNPRNPAPLQPEAPGAANVTAPGGASFLPTPRPASPYATYGRTAASYRKGGNLIPKKKKMGGGKC